MDSNVLQPLSVRTSTDLMYVTNGLILTFPHIFFVKSLIRRYAKPTDGFSDDGAGFKVAACSKIKSDRFQHFCNPRISCVMNVFVVVAHCFFVILVI